MAWFTEERSKSIADDYFAGILTLKQIADKYSIGQRSIYNCASRHRQAGKKEKRNRPLQYIRLAREEIEVALLAIMESESSIDTEKKRWLLSLEEKLLTAADRDEQIKRG